jgi:hypothetical protein
VNNTDVLAQTLFEEVLIETEGVTTGFTVITIWFDAELLGVAQVLLDVTTHQTESLFDKAEVL